MYFKQLLLGCFIFSTILTYGQDQMSHFKGFAVVPNHVSGALYEAFNHAETPLKRIEYMDTIAQIFVKSDLVDSIIAYGHYMHAEAELLDTGSYHNFYKQKAYYFEGMGKREMGLLDDAIATFIEGIEEVPEKTAMLGFLQLGLAETYRIRRDLDKAWDNLLEVYVPETDTLLAISLIAAKADYYRDKGMLHEARELYQTGFEKATQHHFTGLELRLHIELGILKALDEQKEEAISIFIACKQKALELGYYDLYIKAILNEGRMYSSMEDYFIAEIALNTAYMNAVSWNRLILQKKVIRALIDLYVNKDNYKNAYNLTTQEASINQMIANKQNLWQLRDIELKYETLKKQRKIDQLEKGQIKKQAEIDRQKTIKNAVLFGFFLILVPIILLLVVYYQKLQAQSMLNKQQEQLNKQEVQSLLQAQELQLAKTAIAAQNEERGRIARELHDSIGGNLAGIKLQMNNIATQHPRMVQITRQLDTTYEQVREISHSLIPKALQEQTFTTLVSTHLTNLAEGQAVQLNFNAYPETEINALEQSTQVTLFNIIKELVTNGFKHAQAHTIDIQLSTHEEDQTVALLYEDDGVGFDVSVTAKGIGLKNMTHRVNSCNGTIAVDSALQRGTVISINIPKQ